MGYNNQELFHHGIKGQRWGIRRYQNKDGTLTEAGKKKRKLASDTWYMNPKKTKESGVSTKHRDAVSDKYLKEYNKYADKHGHVSMNNTKAWAKIDKAWNTLLDEYVDATMDDYEISRDNEAAREFIKSQYMKDITE